MGWSKQANSQRTGYFKPFTSTPSKHPKAHVLNTSQASLHPAEGHSPLSSEGELGKAAHKQPFITSCLQCQLFRFSLSPALEESKLVRSMLNFNAFPKESVLDRSQKAHLSRPPKQLWQIRPGRTCRWKRSRQKEQNPLALCLATLQKHQTASPATVLGKHQKTRAVRGGEAKLQLD